MTVVSLKNGTLHGYRWDLDRVLHTKAWTLLELDEEEIRALPHIDELCENASGTIVF